MLIPISTDRAKSRSTTVTYLLIATNILAAIGVALMERFGGNPEAVHKALALDPQAFRPWTLVTYAFLHDPSGIMHLAGNMLVLWVFGPDTEDRFGRVGFLVFYLLAGTAAGLAHLLASDASVIGASGAVAGVTGAYLVLFPRTHVRTLVVFIIIGMYSIPAAWFIAIAIARDFWSLGISGGLSPVAHAAHLGGYGFGIVVSMLLLWTRRLEREPYDLFTIARQAGRRRHIRDAAYVAKRRETARVASDPAPLAEARASVSRALASSDLSGAARAYERLLTEFVSIPGSAVLSRKAHLELANSLFQAGEHRTAAAAYQAFLGGYPGDPEQDQICLMIALLQVRYLGQIADGRRMLDRVRAEGRLGDAASDPRAALADALANEAREPA